MIVMSCMVFVSLYLLVNGSHMRSGVLCMCASWDLESVDYSLCQASHVPSGSKHVGSLVGSYSLHGGSGGINAHYAERKLRPEPEEVTLQCDASPFGLGAILLQNEQPVASICLLSIDVSRNAICAN